MRATFAHISAPLAAVTAFAAIFYLACAPLQAADLSGTYEGNGITINIERIGSAWKIHCAHKDENPEYEYDYEYWDKEPFEGQMKKAVIDYQCKPVENVKASLYKITARSGRDLSCSLIGEVIGQPTQAGIWARARDEKTATMRLNNDGSLNLEMDELTLRGCDCGELAGRYYKRK